MCGIAGILGIENSLSNLKDMLEAMHHRGPDDVGTFESGPITLGHKRLSIIDLSAAGHQPMTNQTGDVTIVFNGEIYNYQELKSLLPASIKLKSNTDTEIILELWKIKGTDLFPKLRGMFAIAIWDERNHELVLARDHMGIKPLYYQIKNKQLIFASELKGMLASGYVPKKINTTALTQYLTYGYILQPTTILDEVHMLEPASYLIYRNGTYTRNYFWKITDKPDLIPASEEEAIQIVRNLVIDSVKEESIADRLLGVFLSGGLDSTVLVAALRKSSANVIQTFSVGFDGDDLSEEDDAKEAADFYQTHHTQLQVTDKDIVPHIHQYINALDQPSIDGLNTWLVSKATAKQVTVALSGLGGDELFSGYSIDRSILYKTKYKNIASIIHHTKPIWQYLPTTLKNKLQAYSHLRNLPEFYQTWGRLFSDEEIHQLTNQKSKNKNPFYSLLLSSAYSLLQRISFLHQRGFMLSRLLRDSDAVSMDHSIEVRFPILDYRLVNLSFHLPDNWKIKNVKATTKLTNYEKESSYKANGVKHLLYQAFKNDLPPQFGLRPKRGFKMPIEKWMKGSVHEDIKETLELSDGLISIEFTTKIFKDWMNDKEVWIKVWNLYILKKWIRQNLN